MTRRFISQFGERETVDEVFLLSEKQLRPNRNGNLYLQMRLSDRTGSVSAMMWNATEPVYNLANEGDYVRIQGTTQFYNGNLQIIVSHLDQAESRHVNIDDFIRVTPQQRDQWLTRLSEQLRSVQDFHLRNLVECFLMDEAFMRRFSQAPAAVKNHHAYPGGLLEHVVSLIDLVLAVAPLYPQVNRDVLILGAFVHDIGKIDEFVYDRQIAYSDAGQLLGHLVLGVGILEEKIRQAAQLAGEAFPEHLALALKHIIVSHHGKLEFGSPKVPMTLEAIAIHYLDDLDAKLQGCHELMREDSNVDSRWTVFHPALGRKLFKGVGEDREE